MSVPAALAAEVRDVVGPRGLSAFTARALRRELEHRHVSTLLAALEEDLGAADEELVAEVEGLWPAS